MKREVISHGDEVSRDEPTGGAQEAAGNRVDGWHADPGIEWADGTMDRYV